MAAAKPPAAKKDPGPPPVFKMKVGEIDFAKAMPMMAGDWIAITNSGVKLGTNHNLLEDPHSAISFVLWFAQKVNPAVTREMILEEVTFARVIKAMIYIQLRAEDDPDPNS